MTAFLSLVQIWLGINREVLSVEDAITHSRRCEMPRSLRCVCALTVLGPGTTPSLHHIVVEKRVYLLTVAVWSGSFPLHRSLLGPTASHFRAEGPSHRERNPAALGQTFPPCCHVLQPCCQSRRKTRRTRFRYI